MGKIVSYRKHPCRSRWRGAPRPPRRSRATPPSSPACWRWSRLPRWGRRSATRLPSTRTMARRAAVSTLRRCGGSPARAAGGFAFRMGEADGVGAAAEAVGLRVLFILGYGNPLHGPPQAVVDEAGRRAFAAFAAAAAPRCGGRGHRWEVWNEPNHVFFWNGPGVRPDPVQYAALVRAAVAAIRAADPHGEILIG